MVYIPRVRSRCFSYFRCSRHYENATSVRTVSAFLVHYEALTTDFPAENLVVRASFPTWKLLIFYTACASKTVFVLTFATPLMNRCNMERGKCIVESFFSRSRQVFADMHRVDTVPFQNTIFKVYCLICLCLSRDYSNSFFRIIYSGKPFSFPFRIEYGLLARFDSVSRFLLRVQWTGMWTLIYRRTYYQGDRFKIWLSFLHVVFVRKLSQGLVS